MARVEEASTMAEATKDRVEIAEYYNDFSKRLIDDYVKGNRRISRAIARVNSVITPQDCRILDIGCGIGTSTHEYVETHPRLHAVGVDISPVNIQIAQALFPSDRIQFAVSNLTDGVVKGPFDVVALIDIYEHVPRSDWSTFNAVLGSLLTDRGRIVITTPSEFHQEYLKKHCPEALQIVDETVYFEDVNQLARETQTTVVVYEIISVFRSNDYLHLVLDRQPTCQATPPRRGLQRLVQTGQRLLSELPWSSRAKKRRRVASLSPLLERESAKSAAS